MPLVTSGFWVLATVFQIQAGNVLVASLCGILAVSYGCIFACRVAMKGSK